MKLGNKTILATTIAAAMFTGAASAASKVSVEKASVDQAAWTVSSEKLQALSGDYIFQNSGVAFENNATLAYTVDIDLNDGDKLTFDFEGTALLKGADYVLVALSDDVDSNYVTGDVIGVRISDVDTVNGVSSMRLRISNATSTGISKDAVIGLVEAGTIIDGTDVGTLTLSAPNGSSWSNSACVKVSATDVSLDPLPGAGANSTCVLKFQNQFGLDASSLTDLTAKIDVAQDRVTYVENLNVPTVDGEKATAVSASGTLTPATYVISNNTGALDDFITLDAADKVVYTISDTASWLSIDAPTFNGVAIKDNTVTDEPTLRTYTSTGSILAAPELVYDVLGTADTVKLSPHVVSATAEIQFDDGGANAALSDVGIDGADLYNVGINGSTSKVASFVLNVQSTVGYWSWVEIANESTDSAEIEVDIVVDGETYRGVKLGSVGGESVETISTGDITTALLAHEGGPASISENAKVTATFVVTAKEDKVQVTAIMKDNNGRTNIDVYYSDDELARKWRN